MGHKICSASKWSNSSAKARAPKLQKSAETKCDQQQLDAAVFGDPGQTVLQNLERTVF